MTVMEISTLKESPKSMTNLLYVETYPRDIDHDL
jgi:hypothetical protein